MDHYEGLRPIIKVLPLVQSLYHNPLKVNYNLTTFCPAIIEPYLEIGPCCSVRSLK